VIFITMNWFTAWYMWSFGWIGGYARSLLLGDDAWDVTLWFMYDGSSPQGLVTSTMGCEMDCVVDCLGTWSSLHGFT
jgi:hypothetical protein